MSTFALDQAAALLMRPDAIPVVLMLGIMVFFSVRSLPRRD
jgi:hypothetical protein